MRELQSDHSCSFLLLFRRIQSIRGFLQNPGERVNPSRLRSRSSRSQRRRLAVAFSLTFFVLEPGPTALRDSGRLRILRACGM